MPNSVQKWRGLELHHSSTSKNSPVEENCLRHHRVVAESCTAGGRNFLLESAHETIMFQKFRQFYLLKNCVEHNSKVTMRLGADTTG